MIKNLNANDYVYKDCDYSFKTLLNLTIHAVKRGIMPEQGGLLDQHPIFVDAFNAFVDAETYWDERSKKLKSKLKALGA